MFLSPPPASGAAGHSVPGQPVLEAALPADGGAGRREPATLLPRPGVFGSPVQLDPSVHQHHPHPAGVHLPLRALRLRPQDERESGLVHLQLLLHQRTAQRRDGAARFKRRRAKRAAGQGRQGGPGAARRPRHDVRQRADVKELRADGF